MLPVVLSAIALRYRRTAAPKAGDHVGKRSGSALAVRAGISNGDAAKFASPPSTAKVKYLI
jgi:hypothetical protein